MTESSRLHRVSQPVVLEVCEGFDVNIVLYPKLHKILIFACLLERAHFIYFLSTKSILL